MQTPPISELPQLPDSVWICILKQSDSLPSMGRIGVVSKALRSYAQDPWVWKYKAEYLGISQGESALEQVKSVIISARKRAIDLAEEADQCDLSSFKGYKAFINLYQLLSAQADMHIADRVLPVLGDLQVMIPPQLFEDTKDLVLLSSKVVRFAKAFNALCSKNQVSLAGLALEWNQDDANTLNLSSKKLVKIPYVVLFLRSLEDLNLSNNRIHRLPPQVSNWDSLNNLDLSYNCLNEFPEKLETLKHLSLLDVSHNRIPSLPDWIGDFDDLTAFNYHCNPIDKLPCEIIKLFMNDDFKFDNNNKGLLSALAREVNCPIEVFKIEDGFENRNTIAFQLGDFFNILIRHLKAIRDRPKDIHERFESFTLEDIHYIQRWLQARDALVLWDALAYEIGGQNSGRDKFTESGDYFNKATEFPQWCKENKKALEKLEVLNLFDQGLSTLPKEVAYLTNLQVLHLSDNFLRTLPLELRLDRLVKLNLDHNLFTFPPSQIGRMVQLEELSIIMGGRTRVKNQWGNVFYHLKGLRVLNHNYNDAPDDLYEKLPHLRKHESEH